VLLFGIAPRPATLSNLQFEIGNRSSPFTPSWLNVAFIFSKTF